MRTLLLTLTTCLLVLPANAKYSGGSGTAQDPYQIATAADLIALGETPGDYGKHFLLTADIDLDPKLPGRKVFDKAVIAPDMDQTHDGFQGTPFTGVFDGHARTISHLMVKGGSYLGLFGCLGWHAEVRDLGVIDVNIAGSGGSIGGLVGLNRVKTLVSYGGGTVTGCYSTGVVKGKGGVGGLVGSNCGTVTGCYSTGAVSGFSGVGGLVGWNDGTGTVTGCYSTGAVSGKDSVGGLVGQNYGTVTSSFWDIQTSGQATSAGGKGWTTAQMQHEDTFACWAGDGVWTIDEGKDYPRLAWEHASGRAIGRLYFYGGGKGTRGDPYLIYAADQLNVIGALDCDLDKHFKLMADLDLSSLDGKEARPTFNVIGAGSAGPFTGSFDGNSHTIAHLTVRGTGYLGLFGQLAAGAEVKNLGVIDVRVAGSTDYVGGLVGYSKGTVTQCYSTGVVSGARSTGGLIGSTTGEVTECYSTGAVSGTENVGGLLGAGGGLVTRCWSAGTVSGTGGQVGGLVGYNNGAVTQCFSTGAVSGGGHYVGGLVGSNGGTVTGCYSTGAVNAGNHYAGGLAGSNGGTVTECYSTGAVNGRGYYNAGLVGFNSGAVTECYSTGAISGTICIGGLVAWNYGGRVTACFWDTQTSGWKASDGGTGKTTTQMQTAKTFLDAGWDFVGETKNGTEEIWWILDGRHYPGLWDLTPPEAWSPGPGDRATDVGRAASLAWAPGRSGGEYDVYLGEDAASVAGATVKDMGIYRGRQRSTAYDPAGLEWGKTYYWRIDEVTVNNPAAALKGTVWSFTTTACIRSPHPLDSALEVVCLPILSWVPGEPGLLYDVYFGEDETVVAAATRGTIGIYRGRQLSTATAYRPGALRLNTTYYWRVDGVDQVSPQSPWKGTVWHFSTGDVLVVLDDFESYTDDQHAGATIFQTWIDGLGPEPNVPGNGTGSVVGNEYGPFAEQRIVHGGWQSMPMDYNNVKKPWCSEAERTWATPQDWTVGGADTLMLYFRGKADNSREPFYVGIEDSAGRGAVVVHPDAEAVRTTEWQKWHIALADMRAVGVDVVAVKQMAIGVGDRKNPKPGGTGRIYIDDIRLTKRMP